MGWLHVHISDMIIYSTLYALKCPLDAKNRKSFQTILSEVFFYANYVHYSRGYFKRFG